MCGKCGAESDKVEQHIDIWKCAQWNDLKSGSGFPEPEEGTVRNDLKATSENSEVNEGRELVRTLKKSRGWSNRAIADVVGVDEITVRRDLDAGAQNYAPDGELSDRVTRSNGRSYPAWAILPTPSNFARADETWMQVRQMSHLHGLPERTLGKDCEPILSESDSMQRAFIHPRTGELTVVLNEGEDSSPSFLLAFWLPICPPCVRKWAGGN